MKYRPGALLRAIVNEIPVYDRTTTLGDPSDYLQQGGLALVVSCGERGHVTWIRLLTSSGILGWRPTGYDDGLFKRIAG